MSYEEFKKTVFDMYRERINSGFNPKTANSFQNTDFKGLDYDLFMAYRKSLDSDGYLERMSLRGFVLSQETIDKITE